MTELPLEAMGIWIIAGTWCADYLTDGRITLGQVRRLGGAEELAEALVDAGMWHYDGKHYIFKDWTDYQPTKTAVDAEREASRERQRRAREVREQKKKGGHAPVTPMSQRDGDRSHAPVTEKFECPEPEPVPEPKEEPSLSSHVASDGNGKKTKTADDFPEEAVNLCNHLAELIKANGNKVGKVGVEWWQPMDRLLRLDDYTPDQVRQVIDWCQRDEFWQGNILSAKKLRQQFDQLKTKMFAQRGKPSGPPQQFQSAAERRYAQGATLVADELAQWQKQQRQKEITR